MAFEDDELFNRLLFGRRRELEDGRSYVVKERKPERGLSFFLGLIEKGYRPLYVTRQHPNHVQKEHAGKEIRAIWLSTTLGKDYIDPHNLNSLTNVIASHITTGGKAVVLLDGLEYLNEVVAQLESVLIISVDERAFEPRDLALLERNAVVIEAS